MNTRTLLSRTILLLGGTSALLGGACSDSHASRAAGTTQAATPDPALRDAELDPVLAELLELAFSTASAVPTTPHAKTRAQLQESVVDTCLELDQPRRAHEWLQQIDGWRRGAAYADLAFQRASRGAGARDVQGFLDQAEQLSVQALQGEHSQDWQHERIRVKIARVHAQLGQDERADELARGVTEAESGKLEAVRASRATPEQFEEQLATLRAVMDGGNFDLMRNALVAHGKLFDRFYADAEKRERVVQQVRDTSKRLPMDLRVAGMLDFAEFALEHRDPPVARALAAEAVGWIDGATWTTEQEVPLRARAAGLRFRAGDEQAAREEADRILARYEAGRTTMANVFRAETLRPVAEALVAMEDVPAALAAYRTVLDEGVLNPNSRPRAEDLCATALSLAKLGLAPDAALLARMKEIRAGLREPW